MKKLLFFFLFLFVFFLGMFFSPYPGLHYDPLHVQGVDYGFSDGDYVTNGHSIKVRRVFSTEGLMFIQTPDGTFHLTTPAQLDEMVNSIQKSQRGNFNTFKAAFATLYARLMSFRKMLFSEISDLLF